MSNYIKRPLRHITGWLWPGYLAENDAKAAFAIYRRMGSLARLRDAVDFYQLAVDQRRAHNHRLLPTSLVSCATIVWTRYSESGRRQEDLERVISLGDEALSIWKQGSDPERYIVLVDTMANAWLETFTRSAEDRSRSGPDAHAYDVAFKYLTELKEIATTSLLQRKARMQLGVLIRLDCQRRRITESLDLGVRYLEDVYHEAKAIAQHGCNSESEGQEDIEMTIGTCCFNLAPLYELRYKLVAEDDVQRLEYLNATIEYNTESKAVSEKHHTREWANTVYHLAHQHYQRWRLTRDQSDIDKAIAMTKVARDNAYLVVSEGWMDKLDLLYDTLMNWPEEESRGNKVTT